MGAVAPEQHVLAVALDVEARCPGVWPYASRARMPGTTSSPGLRKVIFSASGTTLARNSDASFSTSPVNLPSGAQKSYSVAPMT